MTYQSHDTDSNFLLHQSAVTQCHISYWSEVICETQAAKLAQAMDNRILWTGIAMLSAANIVILIDVNWYCYAERC